MSEIPVSTFRTFRSPEAAEYWAGLEKGVLRYQFCSACDNAIFYPRSFCPYCMSRSSVEWRTSSGSGTLYTYSELFVAPTESMRSRIPYILGIAEMEEGFYMFGEVLRDGHELEIGRSIRTTVVERDGALLLNFHLV
jgi:uncharacterized protein